MENRQNTSAASTKVVTSKNTRWSYCSVWEPKSINGSAPKYSVSLLIPKGDPCVEQIQAAIEAAYREGAAKLKGAGKSVPAFEAIKKPLRDGDLERPEDEAYQGHWFLNANSNRKPGIIDRARQEILNRDEVYSGCYGPVSINFYAYNVSGNRGVACGLRNMMKFADGEPLGGPESAAEDFEGLEDDLLN